MDSEILDRIEKQMEGNGLALAAVAEVLQKMDFRLSKADTEEAAAQEEQEDVEEMEWAIEEKAELVKAVAAETFELMKAGQYKGESGLNVKGEAIRNAKSMGSSAIPATGSAGTADDTEHAVSINTDIDKVQGVIQAMQKTLNLLKEGDEMPWETDDTASQKDPKGDDEDGDGEGEGEGDDPKNMAYSVQNLEKMVEIETEKRLRKMGFKEETSLMRPTIIDHNNMGTDGGTPISKGVQLPMSSGDDVVDQLTQLSYKQLRDMQTQIEKGDTDGIPQELIR